MVLDGEETQISEDRDKELGRLWSYVYGYCNLTYFKKRNDVKLKQNYIYWKKSFKNIFLREDGKILKPRFQHQFQL